MSFKTISINLAAPWVGSLSSIMDGHVLSEAACWDILWTELAARFGWLKNAVDDVAGLTSSTNTWTGNNEFNTDAGTFQVTGTGDAEFDTPVFANSTLSVNGVAEFADHVLLAGGVAFDVEALTDANEVIDATTYHARVPVVTAARTYTLPSTAGLDDGHTKKVTRVDTAAFAITIQDPTGPTTVGVINSGAAGWIEFVKRGANWRVSAWGGTVSSLSATP